jgi:predicted DNA-binding transcriptional regulator YafY
MSQMSRNEIVETIRQAGKLKKTLWIRAYESNGSIEPREVEPYSFRPKGKTEKLSFHCLLHNGTRNFLVDKIIEVHITKKNYVPRYAVEL